MPHCILEYSDNIIDRVNKKQLLLKINQMLADTGLFKINDIKSRVIKHQDYVMGDGNPSNTFVSLNICILDGRSKEVKQNISQNALKLLKKEYTKSLEQTRCSITVRVTEMEKESYQKATSY